MGAPKFVCDIDDPQSGQLTTDEGDCVPRGDCCYVGIDLSDGSGTCFCEETCSDPGYPIFIDSPSCDEETVQKFFDRPVVGWSCEFGGEFAESCRCSKLGDKSSGAAAFASSDFFRTTLSCPDHEDACCVLRSGSECLCDFRETCTDNETEMVVDRCPPSEDEWTAFQHR